MHDVNKLRRTGRSGGIFIILILSILFAPISPIFYSMSNQVHAKNRNKKLAKKANTKPAGPPVKELIKKFKPIRIKYRHKKSDEQLLPVFRLPAGTLPIIESAVQRKLQKHGSILSAENMRSELDRLKTNKAARVEIAPFLLIETFEAIKSPNKNAVQQKFYKHFQGYFAKTHSAIANVTLNAWRQHKRSANQNSGVGLSVLLYTGPSFKDFVPPENPMGLGRNGTDIIAEITAPALSRDFPEFNYKTGDNNDDLRYALRYLGFSGTATALAMLLSPIGGTLSASLQAIGIAVKALNFAAKMAAKAGAGAVAAGSKIGVDVIATFLGGVAGTAGLIVLFALPILVESIMRIVDTVQTINFENELVKQATNNNMSPDLQAMLNISLEKSHRLCYSLCKDGYTGNGVLCKKNCPQGYVSSALTCQRQQLFPRQSSSRGRGTAPAYTTYSRGRGTASKLDRRTRQRTCPSGKELKSGLCYAKCNAGYTGVGTLCRKKECPSGTENYAGLCYASCPSGYSASGLTCKQTCPAGYSAEGNNCRLTGAKAEVFARETYSRGIGKSGDCISADTRETNKAAIITYLMKMMFADPVERGNEIPVFTPVSSK
ncbi:MAG: hypothetical protein R2681_17630 [Pyrinomonadaceae bacterium]